MCIVAVIVAIVWADQRHQSYIVQQQAKSASAMAQATKEIANANALLQEERERNSELKKQCEIGVEAWLTHTSVIQAKTAQPDCELLFR